MTEADAKAAWSALVYVLSMFNGELHYRTDIRHPGGEMQPTETPLLHLFETPKP